MGIDSLPRTLPGALVQACCDNFFFVAYIQWGDKIKEVNFTSASYDPETPEWIRLINEHPSGFKNTFGRIMDRGMWVRISSIVSAAAAPDGS